MELSKRAYLVSGQPMFQRLAKVKGIEGLIHFEIGDPCLDTDWQIVNACHKSLLANDTHYRDSTGLLEFKQAIQETTLKSRGFKPDLNQILVTPGANLIIYLAVYCLVNPGERVIYPNPGFPTYQAVCKMCETGYDKLKLIIINSPSNPTGKVMTEAEIRKEYDKGVYLLSDEVYSRINFTGKFFSPSMIDKCKDRTILMNSFSKGFAMTGWRLGVCIANKDIIERMGLLLQTLVSCVPPFIQRAGIAALNQSYKPMMNYYKVNRDIICHSLGIKPNEGAFYLFPSIVHTGLTSQQFADLALKHKVVVLPGTDFGDKGDGYIRISYAGKTEDIIEGCKRLKKIW